MHGTFRSRSEGRNGATVRFDARLSAPALAPARRKWPLKLAALLTGCGLALLPNHSPPLYPPHGKPAQPARHKQAEFRAPEIAEALPSLGFVAPRPPVTVLRAAAPARAADPLPAQPLPVPAPPPKVDLPQSVAPTVEPVAVKLPETPVKRGADTASIAPAPAMAPAVPRFALPPLASPPVAVDLPAPPDTPPAALAQPDAPSPVETASAPPAEAPRKIDIAQISESAVRSTRVAQLHEPGLAVGAGPTLADKIAAMQVTPLPPARLRESDRAVLLAEAPTRMTLRIGDLALGKIDFRMTDARTIDVRLASLLDLLAGHFDAAEFSRLRGSAAADAYVSVDQLRALGLKLRYDAVYDELKISG